MALARCSGDIGGDPSMTLIVVLFLPGNTALRGALMFGALNATRKYTTLAER